MRSLILALSLSLSLSLLAALQSGAPAREQPIEALRPFASLVGHDWVADFPGGKVTDTQRFTWVYGGKFLRSTHEVKDSEGKAVYGGETIYAWDAREQRLVWWYINQTGGFVTGTLTPEGEGSWLVEGENHGPAGQKPGVHNLLEIGKDGWSSTALAQVEGEWREQQRLEFRPAD